MIDLDAVDQLAAYIELTASDNDLFAEIVDAFGVARVDQVLILLVEGGIIALWALVALIRR